MEVDNEEEDSLEEGAEDYDSDEEIQALMELEELDGLTEKDANTKGNFAIFFVCDKALCICISTNIVITSQDRMF